MCVQLLNRVSLACVRAAGHAQRCAPELPKHARVRRVHSHAAYTHRTSGMHRAAHPSFGNTRAFAVCTRTPHICIARTPVRASSGMHRARPPPLRIQALADEPSRRDCRRVAKRAALDAFNRAWREEMAKTAAVCAAGATPCHAATVVTCARCKQVITGCPHAHFRAKHRGAQRVSYR